MAIIKAKDVAKTLYEMITYARDHKMLIIVRRFSVVFYTPDEFENYRGRYTNGSLESFELCHPVDMFRTEWDDLKNYVDQAYMRFDRCFPGPHQNVSIMFDRIKQIKNLIDTCPED